MTALAQSLPSMIVEQVPIDQLRPDPANPRRISEDELEALTRSLRQWGFVQPVLARREDSVVIGGHQRLVAARRLGLIEAPVIWLDISLEQARLLNLALNKISGSWDEQLLARLLADLQADLDLDLTLSGFGEDEVRDLLKSLEARERADQPEAFELESALEEARREPRTKPGDLWALGEHRLLCGDATDAEAVGRLLGDAKPRLLATDPPSGVSLDPTWRDGVHNELGPSEKPYMQVVEGDGEGAHGRSTRRTKGHRNVTLSGDTRVDWSEAYELVPSIDVAYIWHAGVHAAEVAAGLQRIGFEIVSQVIWDKSLFAMGRSWYHWSHEPCWVVRRKGAKVPFLGSRDQGTVWRVPSPKMIMAGSRSRIIQPKRRQFSSRSHPEPHEAGRGDLRPVPRVGHRAHRCGAPCACLLRDGDRPGVLRRHPRSLGALRREGRRKVVGGPRRVRWLRRPRFAAVGGQSSSRFSIAAPGSPTPSGNAITSRSTIRKPKRS